MEQGLLTDEELEFALAKQQTSGRRLGETIVECGFVSSPDLSNALAAQYGIELIPETGFGTGLRAQIQRRHESDRGRPALVSVPDSEEPSDEPLPEFVFAEPEAPPPGETIVLAQLEEHWAKLAAAEEWVAEREAQLAVLAAERDRRRVQAERLSRRARDARLELAAERERNEELMGRTQAVGGQIDEQRAKLAAAEQRLAEQERELATLTVECERRRAQVARFVQKVRARDTEIERRNDELKGLAQTVDGQVDEQRAKLAAAEQRLAERERELAALTADRDRRRAQAVGFVRRMRTRDEDLARRNEELRGLGKATEGLRDQVERLTGDVRGCDAEIERLRNENTRRRAQAVRFAARVREVRHESHEAPVVPASSHLVFVQLAHGYELVEREGPPPSRHTPLELPDLCDGPLVVAGTRPSPFPGDTRPCVAVAVR